MCVEEVVFVGAEGDEKEKVFSLLRQDVLSNQLSSDQTALRES